MFRYLCCSIVLLSLGCAQHRSYLLPRDVSSQKERVQEFFESKPGTFHALPRTVAKATIAFTRIKRSATALLTGLTEDERSFVFETLDLEELPDLNPEVTFALSKTQMELTDIPDPEAVVFTELIGRANKNYEFTSKLDEDGTPQSFLSVSQDVTLEQVAAVLGVIGRIASPIAFAGRPADPAAEAFKKVKKIIEAVGSIRQARNKLIANEFVSDTAVLSHQLIQLQRMELELLSGLIKTETEIWMPRVVLDPESASGGRLPILKLSKKGGVVVAPGRDFTPPIPPDWNPGTMQDVKSLELRVFRPVEPTLAAMAEAVKPQQPQAGDKKSWKRARGLIYRIPEPASLQLVLGEKEYAYVDGQIAQFGKIRFLPKHLNTTASTIDAELYPRSGALKRLRVKTHAVSPETITALGAGFEAFAGAAGRQRAAKAQAEAARQQAAFGFAQAIITTTLGAVLK